MAKEKFERLLYLGPVSSFSVLAKAKKGKLPESKDRSFVTGETYDDLPTDHPVISNLIAAKLLVEPPEETEPEETVPDSTNNETGDDRSTSADTGEGN